MMTYDPILFADYALTISFWLASLLQFAAIRDWTVRDSRRGVAYRWVMCAGIVGLAWWLSTELFDAGRLDIELHLLVSLQLIAIGLIGQALEKILTQPLEGHWPNRRASDWCSLGHEG